jgi:hypothetical protein
VRVGWGGGVIGGKAGWSFGVVWGLGESHGWELALRAPYRAVGRLALGGVGAVGLVDQVF